MTKCLCSYRLLCSTERVRNLPGMLLARHCPGAVETRQALRRQAGRGATWRTALAACVRSRAMQVGERTCDLNLAQIRTFHIISFGHIGLQNKKPD